MLWRQKMIGVPEQLPVESPCVESGCTFFSNLVHSAVYTAHSLNLKKTLTMERHHIKLPTELPRPVVDKDFQPVRDGRAWNRGHCLEQGAPLGSGVQLGSVTLFGLYGRCLSG